MLANHKLSIVYIPLHCGQGPTYSWLLPTLLLAALLSACDSAGDGDDASSEAALTYHGDAKPIIDAYCAGCHRAGGNSPFPLTTYDEVHPLRTLIADAVARRRMPPWPPDRACTEYLHDPSLSDAQIAILVEWIATGAPRGDPAEEGRPLEPPRSPVLARVDLTSSMPEAYTPRRTPDDYRCFVLPWPRAEPTHITGFQVQPGTRAVHHVIAFLVPPAEVAEIEADDAADEGPGYDCLGGNASRMMRLDMLGLWAPGIGAVDFPTGTGIAVEPGSRLLLEMHYNRAAGDALPDVSGVDFELEDQVERVGNIRPWFDAAWPMGDAMRIPAGQRDVVHAYAADPTAAFGGDRPMRLHDVGLHMHMLGTQGMLRIDRADGSTECLLHVPRWSFHRQAVYRLAEPRILQPGDRLYLECHWDNPTDRDVAWGEGTDDEMCLGILYFTHE